MVRRLCSGGSLCRELGVINIGVLGLCQGLLLQWYAVLGMIYILTENPTIDRIVIINDILEN